MPVSRKQNKILSDAIDFYNRVAPKEKQWGWTAPHMKRYWDKLDEGLEAALFYAQEEPHIAYNHKVYSQPFGFIVEDMIAYLKSQGFDLSKAPKHIHESELPSPKIKFKLNGRTLSTDFLYRLAIAKSINSQVNLQSLSTVLEIGAGLGTLARCLKLFNNNIRYFIIDLPETLVFSYSFLRANFPKLPMKFITSASELTTIDKEHFVFIPAHIAKHLPKLSFDLIVNNYSLGEMPQSIVLDYMKLIQEQLDVRFLYSLNRYLQDFRVNRAGIVSLALDAHWKTKKWTFCPPFTRIDRILIPTDHRSTLEVLMERIPKAKRDQTETLALSKAFFKEASNFEIKGHLWHQAMWESIRLSPNRTNLPSYVKFLGDAQCSEYPFYLELLKRHGGKAPKLRSESEDLFMGKKPPSLHPRVDFVRKIGGTFLNAFDHQ